MTMRARLEKSLISNPLVREVCVTTAGGELCAFVVLSENHPAVVYDFQEQCHTLFEGVPFRVEVLVEFPKTPMGRVRRELLCPESEEPAA